MTLKVKIIVVIVLLLLSASITTSVINYRVDVEATQAQLKEISLPLSLDNIYTEIQQRMIEPLVISSLMANDTFVKDWILNEEAETVAIQKYLQEIKKRYGTFTAFLVSEKTRNYYHSNGIIDNVNKKHKDNSWYFEFKNSPNNYEVNIDYNMHLGSTLIMFINYKVYDYANNFIAALGIGLELLDIEQMLYSFKEKYQYDVYFIDEQGEIILFTQKLNKKGNIANIQGLKDVQNAIFSKRQDSFEYQSNGHEYLLSVKYIEQLKLYLLVEINKKSYMEELNNRFYINLAVSIFVALLIVLVILFSINIYQKQLEQLADEDSLTGLANRRRFNDDFGRLYHFYQRGNINKLTLILIDIDNFKQVNDELGHLAGDAVLVRLAEIFKQQLRNTDEVARWGGEEFAILLINTSKNNAMSIAQNLQDSIKSDSELKKISGTPITLSLGLAELADEESQDDLISRVDQALYKAKSDGKDTIEQV